MGFPHPLGTRSPPSSPVNLAGRQDKRQSTEACMSGFRLSGKEDKYIYNFHLVSIGQHVDPCNYKRSGDKKFSCVPKRRTWVLCTHISAFSWSGLSKDGRENLSLSFISALAS